MSASVLDAPPNNTQRLVTTETIQLACDNPTHLVIEGDNLVALPLLAPDLERNVDAVYIDPPYGTGRHNLAYRDHTRHEDWGTFMRPRLHAARDLLKSTGILIVAIDDREQHRLRVLLDEVFGVRQFIATIVHQGARKNRARFVATSHDYMHIYARSIDALKRSGAEWKEPREGVDDVLAAARGAWEQAGHDPAGARAIMQAFFRALPQRSPTRDLSRYTHFLPDGTIARDDNAGSPAPGNPRYDVMHPVTGKPVPVPTNGWRYTDPTDMDVAIAAGRVLFRSDHTKPVALATPLDEEGAVPTGVFERSRQHAPRHLADILGRSDGFPYPKDVEVVQRWLRMVTGNRPDAVIVDFFGGTGTTVEAVIRMNAADGGRRRAVLVTTNEGGELNPADGIYRSVTAPRIRTVTTGIRGDGTVYGPGIDANVAFARIEP